MTAGGQARLTPGQQRIYDRVAGGPRKFNGRAIPQVTRLVELGLVTADFDLVIMANHRTRWIITVTRLDGNTSA